VAAAKAPERENEVRAEAKYVRVSARKARLVTEHIRGRSVPEARTVLAFTERAVAKEIEKVLHSAVSNAEANHGMIGDELFVSTVYVDEGPTIKRWRARARGRVARINKRTCHITVKVAPLENVKPALVAPAEETIPKRAPSKRAAARKTTETTAKKPATRKKKEATA
jgi:ribosomal protein L22, bacterial type